MRAFLVGVARLALFCGVLGTGLLASGALWNGVLAPAGVPDWAGLVLWGLTWIGAVALIEWLEFRLGFRSRLSPLLLRPLPGDIFRRVPQRFLLDRSVRRPPDTDGA